MIALEDVSAKRKPLALARVSLTLAAGVHALVGGPDDGGALILELLAGRARARRGRVSVDGGEPKASRRAIAYVPRDVALPDAMTVRESLAMAAEIRRGEHAAPDDRLASLGLSALAARRVRTLSLAESRAVALCEALTSKTVRLFLIDEPFADVDARAVANLEASLSTRAAEGACVLVSTASPADAAALASQVLVMARGSLVHKDAASSMTRSRAASAIRVVASDARALVAALASDPAVHGLATRADAVVVRGEDASAIAAAVARAAVTANVDVHELRAEQPTLEDVQASALARAPVAAMRAGAAR